MHIKVSILICDVTTLLIKTEHYILPIYILYTFYLFILNNRTDEAPRSGET